MNSSDASRLLQLVQDGWEWAMTESVRDLWRSQLTKLQDAEASEIAIIELVSGQKFKPSFAEVRAQYEAVLRRPDRVTPLRPEADPAHQLPGESGENLSWRVGVVWRIGMQNVATVESYDNMSRGEAEARFESEVRNARDLCGRHTEVATEGRNVIAGVCTRVVVDLLSVKGGYARVERQEVFLDDSDLSDRAKSLRDSIVGAEPGKRAASFAAACQTVGMSLDGPARALQADGVIGRISPKGRWIGNWQTNDVEWAATWRPEKVAAALEED